jgi:hypothetical protein
MTPFAPFATATLVFWVPVGDILTPLGNPSTATTPLIVVAYLKADSNYRAQAVVDGQASGQTMSGRMVQPAAMPPTVQDGQVAEITFWRIGAGFELPSLGWESLADYQDYQADNLEAIAAIGEFVWEAIPPGGFGVEAVLGDKIRGKFVARSSWTDSI